MKIAMCKCHQFKAFSHEQTLNNIFTVEVSWDKIVNVFVTLHFMKSSCCIWKKMTIFLILRNFNSANSRKLPVWEKNLQKFHTIRSAFSICIVVVGSIT